MSFVEAFKVQYNLSLIIHSFSYKELASQSKGFGCLINKTFKSIFKYNCDNKTSNENTCYKLQLYQIFCTKSPK